MTDADQRLESLAAFAHELRRKGRAALPDIDDDNLLGEIADQIDLRAWGPMLVDPEAPVARLAVNSNRKGQDSHGR